MMRIRHEHIRVAVMAWAGLPGGEKTPASAISDAYFELGMSGLGLYGPEHPDALSRNTQKIFRWVKSDTPHSHQKLQRLLPAIEHAMPAEP
jgi:hypothetical protein